MSENSRIRQLRKRNKELWDRPQSRDLNLSKGVPYTCFSAYRALLG